MYIEESQRLKKYVQIEEDADTKEKTMPRVIGQDRRLAVIDLLAAFLFPVLAGGFLVINDLFKDHSRSFTLLVQLIYFTV